ncbi:MotA/TolQ/ExbB proton channel family protein [Balneatrix alpica]|uniref:MotA/TolQ/ExbB proton channel family protein n=1 Tax=Balneatrix alpica TaxID=75684 RepID=A0ABV5ZGY2_9GAMM|nr:MotA/TolQ/ExbB proton channel family protein [Balneatrix alpica]
MLPELWGWQAWQQALSQFFQQGGWVLYAILLLSILLWTLLIERFAFRYWYWRGWQQLLAQQLPGPLGSYLQARVCDARQALEQGQGLIKTLIALSPLVGLLGTVSGMIQVFDVLAQSGSANPRLMAAGVAKATLPTLAGMVIAVSGMLALSQWQSWARRQQAYLQLTLQQIRKG